MEKAFAARLRHVREATIRPILTKATEMLGRLPSSVAVGTSLPHGANQPYLSNSLTTAPTLGTQPTPQALAETIGPSGFQ